MTATSGVASSPIATISAITSAEPGSVKTECMNGTMNPGQSVRRDSSHTWSGGSGSVSSCMYGATTASRSNRFGSSKASSSAAFIPRDAVTSAACSTLAASSAASASAAWSGKS